MSDVQISMGTVTLLLPHPKMIAAPSPGVDVYGEVVAEAAKKATSRKDGKAVMEGWHARFTLERHGLQVNL